MEVEKTSNMDVKGLVQIFAYGVPALLIFLGFFAYMGGSVFSVITGNNSAQSLGIIFIILGIAFYVLEFMFAVYSRNNGF